MIRSLCVIVMLALVYLLLLQGCGAVGGGEAPVYPAVTPTGHIAFHSLRSGNWDIFIMNADGSDQKNLTKACTASDMYPAISRDGTKIAFTSWRAGYTDIYTMKVDGSNVQRLTYSSGKINVRPTWAPQGHRIAFASNRRDDHYEIYSMKDDGSDVKRLTFTKPAATCDMPDWASLSGKIAFHKIVSGWSQIYSMNSDGSGLQRLTSTALESYEPSWSPDGQKIVFRRKAPGGGWEIYTMNADGSRQQRLTFNTAYDEGSLLVAGWELDCLCQ